MAKQAQPAAIENPPVTMSAEALKALMAEVRAEALAERNAANKADTAAQMEVATIRAFKRAGFGEVKPRVDVLTFNKWLEKGMRPKEGERAVKVKNLRLFHESQCRPLTKEDRAVLAEKIGMPAVSPLPSKAA
jgi:hypothetical protein